MGAKVFKSLLTKISDTQSALNTLTLSFIFHYMVYRCSLSISLTVYCLGEESALLQTVRAAMPVRRGKKVKRLFYNYVFPKDPTECHKWVSSLPNKVEKVTEHIRVCSRHWLSDTPHIRRGR